MGVEPSHAISPVGEKIQVFGWVKVLNFALCRWVEPKCQSLMVERYKSLI